MINDWVLYDRLKEICPSKNLDDMTIDELLKDANTAFKIVGYNPKNFDKSITEIFIEKNHKHLYDFIYDVWRIDNEQG